MSMVGNQYLVSDERIFPKTLQRYFNFVVIPNCKAHFLATFSF